MTAKQYLSQIRRIKMRVAALSEQLACMQEVAGLASSVLSALPHNSDHNIRKLESEIIRQSEWEEKIRDELNRLEEVNSTLATVQDPSLQTLLVKRYVENHTWETIARELSYSLPQTYRLHDIALAIIETMIANESK